MIISWQFTSKALTPLIYTCQNNEHANQSIAVLFWKNFPEQIL